MDYIIISRTNLGIRRMNKNRAVIQLITLIWVWVNTYRYIFSGMNIHKSQLFWASLGTRVLTHHINISWTHPQVNLAQAAIGCIATWVKSTQKTGISWQDMWYFCPWGSWPRGRSDSRFIEIWSSSQFTGKLIFYEEINPWKWFSWYIDRFHWPPFWCSCCLLS